MILNKFDWTRTATDDSQALGGCIGSIRFGLLAARTDSQSVGTEADRLPGWNRGSPLSNRPGCACSNRVPGIPE